MCYTLVVVFSFCLRNLHATLSLSVKRHIVSAFLYILESSWKIFLISLLSFLSVLDTVVEINKC